MIDELIKKYCSNGIPVVPLWKLTIWDKRYDTVDRAKQEKIHPYKYLLAKDLFELKVDGGDVKLLSTGTQEGWTTVEKAGEYLYEGEIVSIPWGKSQGAKVPVKYFKGKFVTADNRIATSKDESKLLNKYLYYWLLNRSNELDKYYRGASILHPNMGMVLDMRIPLPPLPVQEEIVRILDSMTELQQNLQDELEARKKQYEAYREKLLTFNELGGGIKRLRISDLMSVLRGKRLTKDMLSDNYKYPVYHGGLEPLGFYSEHNRDANSVMVINVGASAGTVGYSDKDFWSSDGCYCLSKTSEIDSKFLYYCLLNKESLIQSKVRHAGIPTLDAKVISDIYLLVPDKSVQKSIVSQLDIFADTIENIKSEIGSRKLQYEFYREKLLSF